MKLFCNFCHSCGIAGPHDHSLRDFSKPGKPITCSLLLTTKCQKCNELGHTKNYCPNGEKSTSPTYGEQIQPLIIKVEKLDDSNSMERTWGQRAVSNKAQRTETSTHISSLIGTFAALDVEDENEGNCHNVDDDKMRKRSWSSIVRTENTIPRKVMEIKSSSSKLEYTPTPLAVKKDRIEAQ